jgi:hypothetical protein
MAIGVLDLSIITDRLIKLLLDAIDASPLWTVNGGTIVKFTITPSGSMPEAVRADGGCQLSVYLYHVSQDKHQRNSPVTGPSLVKQRPLSLELYYLLTVFANKDYVQEQQAMSIALRCFHDNPFVRAAGVTEEFSLTMEVEPADKLSFLWQAVSAPFRLTAVYKVTVAFLEPLVATPPPAPKPTTFTLAADPAMLPFAERGQVLGTFRRVTYIAPDSTPANLRTLSFDLSPAVVAPGQQVTLYGAGLNQATSTRVFLALPDGTEQEVTAWRAADATLHTPSRIVLSLPATVGALPANSSPPGIYQLRVGDATQRSNATPFSIAAAIMGVTNPPLLTPVAGLFTFNAVGLVGGQTQVLLDTVALAPAAGPPGTGEFEVNPGAGTIRFRASGILKPGRYPVRVRVSQVESAPSWWIDV